MGAGPARGRRGDPLGLVRLPQIVEIGLVITHRLALLEGRDVIGRKQAL